MLIDVAFPSLIITEQYSINYFQFLFYVSEKTGNKEFPKSKKLKNIISMKKCKNLQKKLLSTGAGAGEKNWKRLRLQRA